MRNPRMTLGITYYIILTCALLAALAGYKILNNGYTMSSDTAFIIYNVLIWYVIITLPAAISLFRYTVKGIRKEQDLDRRATMYTRYALIRLLVVGVGLIASVLFFYLTNSVVVEGAKKNMSLFWLAGIEAIGLVFCKPTEKRISHDLGEDQETEEEDK